MQKLLFAFGIASAIYVSNAQAENPDALLSKEDTAQMFAMSERQWIANVVTIQGLEVGDFEVAATGEYALYIRPHLVSGLLVVIPSYSEGDKSEPWKVSLTVVADTLAALDRYDSLSEEDVERILKLSMLDVAPEFSVMGYMVRNERQHPSLHISIFRKNEFPTIDALNENGQVCPYQNGRKACTRDHMIGLEGDDEVNLLASPTEL